MAYPKITVNTGLTIAVIASDTIPIPDPGLPQLTGRTTGATGGKLIDASVNFETNGVVIGDIVYNTTDSTVTTITAIDSPDTLSVADNIFAVVPISSINLNFFCPSVKTPSSALSFSKDRFVG